MITTFLCIWNDKSRLYYESRLVIVVEAEGERKAAEKAARAVLANYPEIAEHESAQTFWSGEFGATEIARFRGDVTDKIVDRTEHHIIYA
ncbi:hypothetical protein ACFVQ4_34310 [Streptomyces laurentii]|uniref:hypothetical protein n=1 Tax=Streptomyces laurentii TaxID=39478 RepID=UPI003694547B